MGSLPRGLAVVDRTMTEVRRRLSGGRSGLALGGPPFGKAARLLRLKWSPEQMSGRRKRIEGGIEQKSRLSVSHAAIYHAVYGSAARRITARTGRIPPPRKAHPGPQTEGSRTPWQAGQYQLT